MRVLPVTFLMVCWTLPGFAQSGATDGDNPPATANRSVLSVKPGPPAIKNKDLFGQTGYVHPFKRMPLYVLHDQEAMWTSPFHTSRKNAKWWGIFGGATLALIATDQYTQRAAPNNPTLVSLGTDASRIGATYTLIPIAAGFYFLGTAKHNERFRETGLLAFESLIDTELVALAIKSVADRARPLEGNREGDFEASTSARYNSSFPSGHAMNTFALASVFAHEYSHTWWVKVLAYGYAAGVVGARLAANRHFPGDTVAGGALGWFIGDYVYARHHNPEVDRHANLFQKVLAHVRIGGPVY